MDYIHTHIVKVLGRTCEGVAMDYIHTYTHTVGAKNNFPLCFSFSSTYV